jgi:hypothetical protein
MSGISLECQFAAAKRSTDGVRSVLLRRIVNAHSGRLLTRSPEKPTVFSHSSLVRA